jgi:hypothetical protein
MFEDEEVFSPSIPLLASSSPLACTMKHLRPASGKVLSKPSNWQITEMQTKSLHSSGQCY